MQQEHYEQPQSHAGPGQAVEQFRGFEELLYRSLDELLADVEIRKNFIRMIECHHER